MRKRARNVSMTLTLVFLCILMIGPNNVFAQVVNAPVTNVDPIVNGSGFSFAGEGEGGDGGELHGTLCTSSETSIFDFELRRMLDEFIPPSKANSTLLVFTQCYGGDTIDYFKGRDGTTVLSATNTCKKATYDGYDWDAAKALKPDAGWTSDKVHEAGVNGKAEGETPQKQGPIVSLEPTDSDGEIKSREVLVYAGQPDSGEHRDVDQRNIIVKNFGGQPNTKVTTVGGDGTGGWDHPGTKDGLRDALKDIGERMNENEQFILFVTDHGEKHISKTNITVAPCPCLPAEIFLNIPPEMYHDMILDPSNQPDFCIFSSGPEEISLYGISVNMILYSNYTAYPLDYNGNGIVDEDEGFEYVFLIDEEILTQGENNIKIISNNPVFITLPLIGLGSGAIAKGSPPAVQYNSLTISSTTGGSVTATVNEEETMIGPGETETISDIPAGTGVDLVAKPDDGYEFVEWVDEPIDGVTNPVTAITMQSDYEITANFEEAFEEANGCFIATAAYGTPMAEEIQILREFRDGYLLTNPVGQVFVDFYYRVSPPMAQFITEHPSLKPVVRAGLLPAVVMSTVVVNTTPTEKTAIIGLLALVSVALAVWAKGRRGRGPEYT